jgi:hypothetical protein
MAEAFKGYALNLSKLLLFLAEHGDI